MPFSLPLHSCDAFVRLLRNKCLHFLWKLMRALSGARPRASVRLLQAFILCALSSLFSADAECRWEDVEASYRCIRTAGRRISSSIQEITAGTNMILNRSRGEAGHKSIPRPNDDHHLEHIFSACCCVDVWLSWGSLTYSTTHWSYLEVTFWKGGGAKGKFWGRPDRVRQEIYKWMRNSSQKRSAISHPQNKSEKMR